MNDNILDTLKILLKDNRKLSEQLTELKADNQVLEERLAQLEENQPFGGAVPASSFTQSFSSQEVEYLLDLPLERILDVYSELFQLLEPICCRAALSMNENNNNCILERNGQGNYWVLQLREQGFFLLPRPGAFVRIAALESMKRLFDIEGQMSDSENYQFVLKRPAKLNLLKRNQRWQLSEKGLIKFGESPLEFRWQQEIRDMRNQYKDLTKLLEQVGKAGLEATVTTQQWQQQLKEYYGNPVSILINTCMPIACAIYSYSGLVVVPCNVILAGTSLVVPAWDRGIPLETSFYAKFYDKNNINILRSSSNHPILPNRPYLKENNGGNIHTWAIASDYQEASRIVSLLKGNWQSLE